MEADHHYNHQEEDEENHPEIEMEEEDKATMEKDVIHPLILNDERSVLKEGQYYYLLDRQWWKNWKNYVKYDKNIISSSMWNNGSRPDAIDNSHLLEEDGENVKRSMTENFDFVVINESIWQKLHEWYGGGPEIKRKCISTGSHSKRLMIEIRKLKVKVIYSKRPKDLKIVAFSKATKIGYFIDEMKKYFNFNKDKIRVFDFHQGTKIKELQDMNQHFDDVQILDGQYMLIEERKKDGRWPNEKIYQRHGYGRSSMYSHREPTPPGRTGLVNLGNTCFMNSALQCLSHTAPLIDFFMSGSFSVDINKDNPLGMKGEVAEEYSELLKELWSSRTAISEPRQFKKVIEKFAPRFSGYQQHDSQELLAFLLDGLHEDLNRIRKKPYVEKVEGGEDKDDRQVALEAWDGHRRRNDSIIVDLIQGQLKSTLTCPVDKFVSITFDPFMYLTVQLPVETTRRIPIKVHFLNKDKSPGKFSVVVEKGGTISDLKKALSALCGVEANNLALVDVYNHRFHHHFQDHNDVNDIKEQDKIHAHEVIHQQKGKKVKSKKAKDPAGSGDAGAGAGDDNDGEKQQDKDKDKNEKDKNEKDKNEKDKNEKDKNEKDKKDNEDEDGEAEEEEEEHVEIVHLPVLHSKLSSITNDHLFGTPFIVSVPLNITYRQFYTHLIQRLTRFLTKIPDTNIPLDTDDDDTDDDDKNVARSDDEDDNNKKVNPIFKIEQTDNWGRRYSSTLRNDDRPLFLREKQTITLLWTKDNKREYYDERSLKYSSDSSVHAEKADIASKMNLYECLNLYNKEEQLGPNDTWYCSNCKEFRQAYKKFDIWSAPKILIIHLKRFSYRHRFREKLDNHIDCPLENLDMSKYVIGPSEGPLLYDLYAVSNHYGNMGGGHYTAFAKHRDNGKWYCFDDHSVREISENQVIIDAAYVLFYKRKDVNWTDFNPLYDVLAKDEESESSSEEDEEMEESDSRPEPSIVISAPAAGVGPGGSTTGSTTTITTSHSDSNEHGYRVDTSSSIPAAGISSDAYSPPAGTETVTTPAAGQEYILQNHLPAGREQSSYQHQNQESSVVTYEPETSHPSSNNPYAPAGTESAELPGAGHETGSNYSLQ